MLHKQPANWPAVHDQHNHVPETPWENRLPRCVNGPLFFINSGIMCAITGCLGDLDIPVFGPTGSFHPAEKDGKLSSYFHNVGQGDSSLLIFVNKTILIDQGETEMGDRVVGYLKALGVTRIDLLVATHPHSDHIGGMQKVMDNSPVGQVLDSGMLRQSL